MTARHERARLYPLVSGVAVYVSVAVAWGAFARLVVPRQLGAEPPAKAAAAVKHYIDSFASAFLPHDTVARWHQFAMAVHIAIFLYFTIVLYLHLLDRRAARKRTPRDLRAERLASRWLTMLSLVFLAVTLVSGPIHDYYFYLNMWYEVEQGHDPWFLVAGANGTVPLNAYGPLFNVLAVFDWLNPLAPKLVFAYAYILFAVTAIKNFTATRRPSLLSLAILTALFWNPFPWVEIAFRGHFDILVALLCVGAIRAWIGGRDVTSGTCLALGVLLKYSPVVLLPFLALDRGRIRWKVASVAVTVIAVGMGGSYLIWGPSLWKPLTFAATRGSTFMSIFFFLRGRFSPLQFFITYPNCDPAATVVLFVGLLRCWSWYRTRHPDIEGACVAAVATTAILYRTGFPQYHMVPFVLGLDWVVRHWELMKAQTARMLAIAGYLGWLAVLDFYYLFVRDDHGPMYWEFVEQLAGLPTFLFGCAFIAAVVLSSRRSQDDVLVQPGSGETDSPGTGVGRSG